MEDNCPEINAADLRVSLAEMKNYVDITEEDLSKIYAVALKHAVERLKATVSVGSVMTANVITVRGDADMHDAARLLSENRISGMPVVDDEDRVIGIITEADILSGMGLHKDHAFKDILKHLIGIPLPRRKPGDRVGDVMTTDVLSVKTDSDIREAAVIMDEKRIKRLPVTDGNNRLIGIISRADIVRASVR